MKPVIVAALAASMIVVSRADTAVSPPLLQFATGLPGKQVQLRWNTVHGVRYHIEKSTDLGAGSGGGGGWSRVAVVEAGGSVAEWTDPIPTSTRAFYRIVQPQAEVFSITEPVLSSTGGTLLVAGQCIPDGSFLTLEVEGLGPVSAALVSSGPGQWTATFGGGFVPGANVLSAAVTEGTGTTICPVDADIQVTSTGFATDAPPGALPPGAPVPLKASKPVPGIGVIIKKHPPSGGSGKRTGAGEDCDDISLNPLAAALQIGGSRDQCRWDTGPCRQARTAQANPLYQESDLGASNPLHGSDKRLAPGRNGMPGEVTLEYDALTLVCPAGPPVTWTMNYRSIAPASSGHGAGWDFSYNIFIEAVSNTAPTVTIHDGAGRADVFRRAADGSYRADGFSRAGQFAGDVFTLTFASGGTWRFHAVDGTVTSGKIQTITDANGNAIACSYDGSGKLSSVSSSFGQSLAVTWSGGRVTSVTDHTGRSVSFSYDGSGALESIGCPTASGLPPAAGPTTFTYSRGTGTPRLDGNLLSVTDGAGRVIESFTYAPTTNPADLEFDTVLTHSAHEMGHKLGICHVASSSGGRVVYENDELGRVTETVFDRLHRPLIHRAHNGFHTTPGGTVSPSDFPLTGKTRITDPDCYETTWTYNADSNVTAMTGADGSKMLTTYERDLNPSCTPIERGNARVQTLVSMVGEKRSITMEYQPNTGTPENARPGGPIRGMTVKGGRNPSGFPEARPGNPIRGMTVKGGRNPSPDIQPGYATRRRVEVLKSNRQGDPDRERGITINTTHVEYETAKRLIWSPRSNIDGPDDGCDGISALLAAFLTKKGYDYWQAQSHRAAGGHRPRGWDGTVKGSTYSRCGPGDYLDEDDDDDGLPTIDERQASTVYGATVQLPARDCRADVRLTRLTTSHGQNFTWTYDAHGNCTSATTPISGGGAVYVYDAQGRLTDITTGNGANGEFRDALAYGSDGFLQTYTEDATPGGRNLTTTFEHDALGRVTRIVDPMTDDWLLTWSPLDVCTQTGSPPVAGQRITTDFTYDASGRLARCDVQLRDRLGNIDPAHAAYSTFWVYDSRGRLARIATEERPTDTTGLIEPDPLTLANFAVTNFTYDAAGQVIRASTPAASRGQSGDMVVNMSYDERGLLYRAAAPCIRTEIDGQGQPVDIDITVTTEYDYDALGSCIREACVTDSGGATNTLSATLYAYDAFHRPASVTDAMGNVATFDYGNDGYVTCSVFGETEDAVGSAGNRLLFRMRHKPEILFQSWDNEIQTLTLPGVTDACYSLNGTNSALRGSGIKKGTSSNDWNAGASARHYAHVDCPSRATEAFFTVYQEDDVIRTERFSPGSATSELETTVIDRSPAGLVMAVTRNGDLLASYGYDSSGALSSISNAAGVIDFDRDGRQDVVVCGRTDHFRVTTPSAPKTYSHTITRDSLGRITAVTDGAGNASSYGYDSLGRCTSLADPGRPPVTFAYDGGDATGPYSVVAACDIDNTGSSTELGRCLVRCGTLVSSADSNGYTTTFTYDTLGRLGRCDMPDGTYATCSYDARGFTHSGRLLDGSGTDLSHDALGRVLSVRRTDQSGIPSSEDTSYAYDGLGRLVRATQGSSSVAMTWDSVGNPTSETTGNGTVLRTYNHRGRTSVTYPGGSPIPETRNEFGQLTNTGGNLTRYVGMRVYQTVQTNGVVTTYSYRGEGDTSPPGDASYDSCVRVTSVSGTTTLSDVLIQRSPDQRVNKAESLSSSQLNSLGRVRTYTYDGLGRVTGCRTERVETPGATPVIESDVHYTLDAAGRRLSVTGGAHPGTYTQSSTLPPGDRQMGQYTTWPGGNLEWDDRGNLTLFTDGTDVLDIDSDGDGRLARIHTIHPGMATISYPYDALGRITGRIVEDTNGLVVESTTFVWDGPRMVQELDDPNGTGTLSAALTFVCGDGGIRHCISTRNGTMYYPVNTHARQSPSGPSAQFGHALALADELGAVVERYDHDEAGELFLFDGSGAAKTTAIGPVRWMDPEALRDSSTGLIHGHGMVYSPLLGVVTNKEKPKSKSTSSGSDRPRGHVTLMK